jgi:hypothetical protein
VNPKNIFTELKRRNVYRAAVAYGVVAWFLTQLTTQVLPLFEIPNSAMRFVVIALVVGFPIAMLLAWLYELTPEGAPMSCREIIAEKLSASPMNSQCDPNGIRTRVTAVKGRCPGPLDDRVTKRDQYQNCYYWTQGKLPSFSGSFALDGA